ncbi:hypothetical protein IM40_01045 [Candidatus Paracaedimonas acanthamoebae]|nr:hypothetical protein IM40_01045 [Candidatus Paracaedimonas acanthamoebae]
MNLTCEISPILEEKKESIIEVEIEESPERPEKLIMSVKKDPLLKSRKEEKFAPAKKLTFEEAEPLEREASPPSMSRVGKRKAGELEDEKAASSLPKKPKMGEIQLPEAKEN